MVSPGLSRTGCARKGSISFGVLQLLNPVEAHLSDDAAVDDDDARFVFRIGIEVLMRAIRRNVDEIALLPLEALGLLLPREIHLVIAVEAHIPVQIVALALDDVEHFLGDMAVLAGGFAGRNELLI